LARKLRSIVAQLVAGFHELNEGSCTREGLSQSPSCINTKEEHYVSQ
jgi:hypothetical protein